MVDRGELTKDQLDRLVGIARVTVRGKGGTPACVERVRAYIREGVRPRGWEGEPIRLEAVLIGNDYCTLPEWVEEFELARARAGHTNRRLPAAPSPRAATVNRAAARSLDRAGVK
jgi:hypothetical protein